MASEAIQFETTDTPDERALLVVDTGLDDFNNAAAALGDVKPLAAFARIEPSGEVVGGAVGRTWGACCELQQLWVDETRRSAGLGARLVRDFEARAKSRGCTIFYLTTLSFQAPDFYRKLGYGVLAEISGYPDGVVKYLMHKFVPGPAAD